MMFLLLFLDITYFRRVCNSGEKRRLAQDSVQSPFEMICYELPRMLTAIMVTL